MELSLEHLKQVPVRLLVYIGVFSGILLIISFLPVQIHIIVENPDIGDITAYLALVWRILSGIATVGSFLLAAYNFRGSNKEDGSQGPATGFEVKTVEGDFHYYNVDFENGEKQSREQINSEKGTEEERQTEEDRN